MTMTVLAMHKSALVFSNPTAFLVVVYRVGAPLCILL